ncbi:hypothetical protein PIB30_039164 [Stylosanthes scabra]|uniref:Retrotransposon gag domain-containing protein n=1 Tax=Stylosanthes scabra TaxID=79078 RepID=A0ABU6WE69_9FABA|nr:hypothetical protein [Stylosanthes scabra]
MVTRFNKNIYYDHRTALKELQQGGSVEEYQAQFEDLSNRATRLSEEWIVLLFIAGLQEHLKSYQWPNYTSRNTLWHWASPKLGQTATKPAIFPNPSRFVSNRTLNPINNSSKPITSVNPNSSHLRQSLPWLLRPQRSQTLPPLQDID